LLVIPGKAAGRDPESRILLGTRAACLFDRTDVSAKIAQVKKYVTKLL